MTDEAEGIARNVRTVLENIRRAAEKAGRHPKDIRLVAVTKTIAPERIRAAVAAGVSVLGENRLQEALPKIEAVGPRDGLSWHFIGTLQRRKVKSVVGRFALIHSVDSVDLAEEIDRRAGAAGIQQEVLLEVNVGGESSKAGCHPDGVAEAVAAVERLPHVVLRGLMTVPPPTADPESARPYFRRLRMLAESAAATEQGARRLRELSMGMSQDYAVAVEEGATLVRVGTAIFGPRRS
jgi:pyridoxal phosphate enzyme (YggS family)